MGQPSLGGLALLPSLRGVAGQAAPQAPLRHSWRASLQMPCLRQAPWCPCGSQLGRCAAVCMPAQYSAACHWAVCKPMLLHSTQRRLPMLRHEHGMHACCVLSLQRMI